MPGGAFRSGDHVTLRPVEEEDLEFLRDNRNDPRVRRALAVVRPSNRQSERERFEELYDGEDIGLLACVGDDPVGYVSLPYVDISGGHATISCWITPDRQESGYGTEAVALALDYLFDERRLHRVDASTLDSNAGGRALLETLGFTHEGVKRQETYVDGAYVDVHCFGLLESEWVGSEAI